MLAATRHDAILDALAAHGTVATTELAERLGVSVDTVRRDLLELEHSGHLRRVHGGAVRPAPGKRRFVDRVAEGASGKAVVGALAAQLLRSGQLIAVGGGTTTLELARALSPELSATVVTTSPDVAVALRDLPDVDVIVPGGRLDRTSQTLVGAETIAQIQTLRPDLCVIGACSVHPEYGITLREREEAQVLRALVERSHRLVVLATAEKLGTAAPHVVSERIDALVSDAPAAELEPYAQAGIELVRP
ncbi:DeoR/GlpR transcriptional regulator [Solirubrobacter sp. CPCC 204708]|uniref:Lactose phosphotransferase system repressor n=1 Tax=Solirubrobacter deserti TaxID=2282478 RepID=A0ABT4RCN3_9ACTN|nr:DeoR/GlpR family DNA-binding transcription regulator [Solirubrobacter deserti]MBE2315622.1 DeoR/GlpR transcriptional regulator [Solirubrobacter deserti]MDA0136261.1 DeoR/GlpR family DNA-binding transcription regulator [Solirubrobacter deserti]